MRRITRSPVFDAQAEGLGLGVRQVDDIVGAIQFMERMNGLPPSNRIVKTAVPGSHRDPALPRYVWVEFDASATEVRLIGIRARPF